MTRLTPFALAPLLALACGDPRAGAAAEEPRQAAAATGATCEVVAADMRLPREVPESSGLARSARDPGLFWTHNDAGNDAELFAVDAGGALVQRVRVTGAELVDWEDIEAAPCGERDCLYVGDIGDNDGERQRVTVYRVVEPEPGATGTQPAEPLHARYPDGPRDAEALFIDASGTLHLVTKGRRDGVSIYRWPAAPAEGGTVMLERVRDLFPEPEDERDRVTAASATPDGRWIGIRTYRTLYLYPADRLLGQGEVSPATIDLSGLGQAKGEALVLGNDGTVWLSSEAEDEGRPRWSRLRCAFPGS